MDSSTGPRPSPLPTGYRIVDIPFERRDELAEVNAWAFPSTLTREQRESVGWPLDFARTRGVESPEGRLVACHSSFEFSDHPVPGARVPVSGLTWVGVHPGHRRRGLLSAMIADHFARSLDRGEAVSMLWASEMNIYGRFGYGLAARAVSLKIARGAALRDVEGSAAVVVRFEEASFEKHSALYQRLTSGVTRPGATWRSTPALAERAFLDPEFWRDGHESLRIAIAERDGVPVGIARFRRKPDWGDSGPAGKVEVRDYVATDAAVTRALWGVLLDLDLMATVQIDSLPVDDPLLALLVYWPAAEPRLTDNLWTRLLDVPRALAARRYAAPVDVVLEVTDARLPQNSGRWHLVGGPDGATVTAADDDAPHLALDVAALGAAYLGGTPLTQLAGAGAVRELEPGTLAAASTAFGWAFAPAASWVW